MGLNRKVWRTTHLLIQWLLIIAKWQTYISIYSIFQALQGAANEMFICDILKIGLTSLHSAKSFHTKRRKVKQEEYFLTFAD